mgnify:CR=1 FL=1
MATNFHQPSVHALFDAMPTALITFGVNGVATYANRAARLHPDKPVEAMSGRIVIKNLAQAIALGKVKLPYPAEVGVADGKKLKGMFMAGPSGLDIAFVALPEEKESTTAGPGIQSRMGLEQIIELLQDEVGPPMRKLTSMLGSLPESEAGNRILVLEPSHFAKHPMAPKTIEFILSLAENIPGIQVYYGEYADLNVKGIFRDHPINAHFQGIREVHPSLAPGLQGEFNSFFSFWNKLSRQLS